MIRALLLSLLLVAPGSALAQGRPNAPQSGQQRPAAGRVSIQVMVVHATDSENGIDPRLRSLESSFRYFKYKGYRLLSTQTADVGVDDTEAFQIEGDRRLKVTLMSRDDSRARVRVEMSNKDGKLLDTTVSINRDGTFIVAGPKYRDGILMLPLRASY
ncbi:MAG: hypothetical protein ACOZNI_04475 [Myxococcota bacterium]